VLLLEVAGSSPRLGLGPHGGVSAAIVEEFDRLTCVFNIPQLRRTSLNNAQSGTLT
jgi:hypothetical protein